MELARGYIASGAFNGHRVPQHIQNIVVRNYCSQHHLEYVLSRAEYSEEMNKYCQLWAALREGYKNIVSYSIWQLPMNRMDRDLIFNYAISRSIRLHFACEQLIVSDTKSMVDINSLVGVQSSINLRNDSCEYLSFLKNSLINHKTSL